jgi:alpha/beta superfamily hydrolase
MLFRMDIDISEAPAAKAFAVLLHPHPDFGGDRFHPFIDALFRRLPDVSVSAVRFDFSTSDPATARAEAVAAIDDGATRWPALPVVLVGYSFGAGIAAGIDDRRIAAWYLLAPPLTMLSTATVGQHPRLKAVVVPEYDQFSPPPVISQAVAAWQATTVSVAPDADHFLGRVQPVFEAFMGWMAEVNERLFVI